jgi:hypothetical protein
MGLYDYENSVLLFKNERNAEGTNPPWSGGGLIGGKKYKVSIWPKQGKLGLYLQVKFDPAGDGEEANETKREV